MIHEQGTLLKDQSGTHTKTTSLSLTPTKSRMISGVEYFKYRSKLKDQASPPEQTHRRNIKSFVIQKKHIVERKIRAKEKVNSDIVSICDSFEYKKQFGKNQITVNSIFNAEQPFHGKGFVFENSRTQLVDRGATEMINLEVPLDDQSYEQRRDPEVVDQPEDLSDDPCHIIDQQ